VAYKDDLFISKSKFIRFQNEEGFLDWLPTSSDRQKKKPAMSAVLATYDFSRPSRLQEAAVPPQDL
jgi:hypothetical protein